MFTQESALKLTSLLLLGMALSPVKDEQGELEPRKVVASKEHDFDSTILIEEKDGQLFITQIPEKKNAAPVLWNRYWNEKQNAPLETDKLEKDV